MRETQYDFEAGECEKNMERRGVTYYWQFTPMDTRSMEIGVTDNKVHNKG